jgi:hypothetical protein
MGPAAMCLFIYSFMVYEKYFSVQIILKKVSLSSYMPWRHMGGEEV